MTYLAADRPRNTHTCVEAEPRPIHSVTVGVTTVAFSKSEHLLDRLRHMGFREVRTNMKQARLTRSELVDLLRGCDAAIVGLDRIDAEILRQAPHLQVISKYGVGLDNISLNDCESRGIVVCHSPGVNRRSVAELTLGFMLALLRNIHTASLRLMEGIWVKNGGTQLTGKSVGIIGVGNVGKELVSLLRPFNCRILVNDVVEQTQYYKRNNLTESTKERIFRESDIVTLHTPLTPQTDGLVDSRALATMKPSAVLINTARGGIVVEDDLKTALINKVIAGAALDVHSQEPPDDLGLLKMPNVIATPHIGGNAYEAVNAMGVSAIDNLIDFYRPG